LIAILIIIILIVVGISYGWTSIENLQKGYSAIKQVIESKDLKEGSELGQDLAQSSMGFLEERYDNYKSNNPEEFP